MRETTFPGNQKGDFSFQQFGVGSNHEGFCAQEELRDFEKKLSLRSTQGKPHGKISTNLNENFQQQVQLVQFCFCNLSHF